MGEDFCTIMRMVPYTTIKIFTSKISVNIQGVSQNAGSKRMDDIFKTKIKLVKFSSKTEKLTSYFLKEFILSSVS